ncbi:MAG: chromosomal replication initiator protein DnaA, partial [Anaerolineales bacterium]|nr:chromosomal replication initiator protein DnaA [Anaerolineales bacterium]
MSPETAWKATIGELELQMTKATFNTWLKDARLIAGEANEFVIGVRNDYAKDWLENRLYDTILRTLTAILGQRPQLRFVVWSDELIVPSAPATIDRATAVSVVPALPQNGTLAPLIGTENLLNQRFTFASFVVGTSNR